MRTEFIGFRVDYNWMQIVTYFDPLEQVHNLKFL
jgi:hypothetical protein